MICNMRERYIGLQILRAKPSEDSSGADRESVTAFVASVFTGKYDAELAADIWKEKERLMRGLAEVDNLRLPKDPDLLRDLQDAVDALYIPVRGEEMRRKNRLLGAHGRWPLDDPPLTREQGAILTDEERLKLQNTFSRIRRAGWKSYVELRFDNPGAENPPALPIDVR